MSVNEFINQLEGYNGWIALGLCLIPLIIWLYGKLLNDHQGNESPHKYVYSFFTYLVSAPGILSFILLLYSLFIARINLLDVNLVIYALPAGIMITSMVIIGKAVSIRKLPGFDRLLGLYIMLGATFIVVLIVIKMQLFVFFSSSIGMLILFTLIMFLIIKFGSRLLFRKKQEEEQN